MCCTGSTGPSDHWQTNISINGTFLAEVTYETIHISLKHGMLGTDIP